MVEKNELKAGYRVVQNDPEEPTDNPFKGTVLSIVTHPHTSDTLFWIKIRLDEEFREQYRMQCSQGEMICFPWQIDRLKQPAQTQELLEKMKEIVSQVMLSFQTDFTQHDTDYITGSQAQEPFIWIVRENGTHLYTPGDNNAIRRLQDFVEHYDNSRSSYLIYVFTGQKLIPVFRSKLMEWAEKLLSDNK